MMATTLIYAENLTPTFPPISDPPIDSKAALRGILAEYIAYLSQCFSPHPSSHSLKQYNGLNVIRKNQFLFYNEFYSFSKMRRQVTGTNLPSFLPGIQLGDDSTIFFIILLRAVSREIQRLASPSYCKVRLTIAVPRQHSHQG